MSSCSLEHGLFVTHHLSFKVLAKAWTQQKKSPSVSLHDAHLAYLSFIKGNVKVRVEGHLISRLGVANGQFHLPSLCPWRSDGARGKQLIPLSQAGLMLVEARSGKRHSGPCFLEHAGQQSFFQLLAARNDCSSGDREMERPRWLQLAPGGRLGDCVHTEKRHLPPSTEAREGPGLHGFQVLFLFQTPTNSYLELNCTQQFFWAR